MDMALNFKRRVVLQLLCTLLAMSGYAQQQHVDLNNFTNEQLGSIYYAYPSHPTEFTDSPKGYVPFYISHYGRHGSRWITEDERYTAVLNVFKAHELTELGQDVKERLQEVWEDAEGRSGDLTPLGTDQHKGIAERMINNYPEVFKNKSEISARSSTSGRCVMSMAAFSERLKEINPSLNITREANQRYMDYIAYTTPEAKEFSSLNATWRKDFEDFQNKHINPKRLLKSLFKFPDEIREPHELMMGLYWIASDIQNVELDLTFYDIFEKQELFDIWQCINYRMYVCNAGSPLNEGIMPRSATSLLKNIIESADLAIAQQNPSATLRFGHDTNLIRLLTLMQIEDCNNKETDPSKFYQAWQDFKVSPMAANLQMIFYKNKEGEIIVKFLHNEKEVKLPIKSSMNPYYKWSDVKALYADITK